MRGLRVWAAAGVLAAAWWWGAGPAAGQECAYVLEGHTGAVRCVAFSPDGKTIATGGDDGMIRLWDAAPGKEKPTTSLSDAEPRKERDSFKAGPEDAPGPVHVYGVAFASDGKTLIASMAWNELGNPGGQLRAWDFDSKKLLYKFDSNGAPLFGVAPDGKTIAAALHGYDIDLRDATTGEKLGALEGRDTWESGFAFSPDGKLIAIGNRACTYGQNGDVVKRSGNVELWDLKSQKMLVSFRATSEGVYGVGDIAFAPDCKTLAAHTGHYELRLFDLEDLDDIKLRDTSRWSPGGMDLNNDLLKYTPDGKELVAATSHGGTKSSVAFRLTAWSGRYLWKDAGRKDKAVRCIAFSPDGKLLAMAGGDDKVPVWKFGDD